MVERILCVHQGYEWYGSDKVFSQSVQALRQHYPLSRIDIHLPKDGALTPYLQPYADHIEFGNLFVLRKSSLKLRSAFFIIRNTIYCFKKSRNYQRVYINTVVVLPYLILSLFQKKKYILHMHEIPGSIAQKFFKALLHFSKAHIIVNSKATRQFLPSHLNATLVYNGIPDTKIVVSNKSSDQLNLLLIGRINSWKGHILALKALNELRDQKIILRIVGGVFDDQTQFLEEINHYIHQNNLADKIQFYGFTSNPDHHYQWADIILVPSVKPEPFGLVAVEAMRAGKTVIAADHGGLAEIVIDEHTGILFKPGCVNSLVKAISLYLHGRQALIAHGNAGKKRFQKHFQEKHYKENFLRVIGTAHE